jgi:hypothetical protein
MSLKISKGLTLRRELPADAEADAYIAAVEAADGQALEPGVKFAIKNFVLCCKQDGIWNAIKASCILAGARTLSGALVPLVGVAPTNFNFVSGDYNRKTGLVGDGSTKYLDSNRNNNADPQNNNHNSVFINTISLVNVFYMGSLGEPGNPGTNALAQGITRSRTGTSVAASPAGTNRLFGISRASSTSYSIRVNNGTATGSTASETPENQNILIFRRASALFPGYSNARLAFYSIGESLDLALLDARVTDLINAFAAAIP